MRGKGKVAARDEEIPVVAKFESKLAIKSDLQEQLGKFLSAALGCHRPAC
ncbi:hypothetical protein TIFTF001_026094 [Ficus carica]|uniref:Uncharacterized protein n=1 Tax=Ficus carica TaxID=3494 RepID=A0AA88DG22_FICCA|nr:hypothetical protein TIFTF001_026094 [Ficus carica]